MDAYMKTAVVFYSHDGNCAFVVDAIKAQLNADLVRLPGAQLLHGQEHPGAAGLYHEEPD
jgi:hypothetical protein